MRHLIAFALALSLLLPSVALADTTDPTTPPPPPPPTTGSIKPCIGC